MNHPETSRTGPPQTSSRRNFLKHAQSLGIAAAVLPWLAHTWAASALAAVGIQDISPETTAPPSPTAPSPSQGSGASPEYGLFQSPQTYALSLGGPPVQVFGFHGGEPLAQYVTGAVTADGSFPKKLSGIQYQDIVFHYLPIKGAAINNWLSDSLLGKAPSLSGGIRIQDSLSGGVNISYSNRVSFTGAVVKEIAFPEADRSTSAPAPLRITLAIQEAEWFPESGTMGQPLQTNPSGGPLKGLFKISIQSLVLGDVTRIEPLIFSATVIPPSQGKYRSSIPRDLSTLRIQVPESQSGDLYAWHKDFVMKRLNSDAHERAGTIQWLSPQSPPKSILTLKLTRLGILSVVRIPLKPGYVQAEMYCEKLVPEFF